MYDDIAPRQQVWVRQTAAVAVLRVIVEELGPRAVLPVKGIVTARTLYDDPADRPISDIDLRLPSARLLPQVLAFAKAHAHPISKVSHAYDNVVLDIDGVDVDVECHVGPPGLSGMTIAAMLARAELRDDVFGFPCSIPELHDHALLLCINAFKDKLVLATPWAVADLLRIGRAPGFEPPRFARLARASSSAALAWIVADWLSDRSDAWRVVRGAIGPRAPRPLFSRAFRWAVARDPLSMPARLLARTGADHLGMRVRALAGAATFQWRDTH